MFPRPVGQESQDYQPEELNRKAIAITQRVKQKLTGEHPACIELYLSDVTSCLLMCPETLACTNIR